MPTEVEPNDDRAVRLPHEVAPLFRAWLDANHPGAPPSGEEEEWRRFPLRDLARALAHPWSVAAGDAKAFRASPAFDGMTLALAARLIDEMKLGKGSAPDIIAIGLSATDYVGHTFGPGGGEMCLQLHSLDRDLGDFLRFLDRSGLDYSVMLTADHGGEEADRKRVHDRAASAGGLVCLPPPAHGTRPRQS